MSDTKPVTINLDEPIREQIAGAIHDIVRKHGGSPKYGTIADELLEHFNVRLRGQED